MSREIIKQVSEGIVTSSVLEFKGWDIHFTCIDRAGLRRVSAVCTLGDELIFVDCGLSNITVRFNKKPDFEVLERVLQEIESIKEEKSEDSQNLA